MNAPDPRLLLQPVAPSCRVLVVVSGEIQVLRPSGGTEALIVTRRPGQFSGEGNMCGSFATLD